MTPTPGPDEQDRAKLAIPDDADDAMEGGHKEGDDVDLRGKTLELGGEEKGRRTYPTVVGLRYRLPIPAGAVIDEATITFTVAKKSKDRARLEIRAEATDDARGFRDFRRDLSSRTGTEASVSWDPPEWDKKSSGADQTTPDLAAVLQELVDRPGWTSGNDAALLITGSGQRTASSFRDDDKDAAVLDVTWSVRVK